MTWSWPQSIFRHSKTSWIEFIFFSSTFNWISSNFIEKLKLLNLLSDLGKLHAMVKATLKCLNSKATLKSKVTLTSRNQNLMECGIQNTLFAIFLFSLSRNRAPARITFRLDPIRKQTTGRAWNSPEYWPSESGQTIVETIQNPYFQILFSNFVVFFFWGHCSDARWDLLCALWLLCGGNMH